jgi:hypothetical protein
MEGKDSCGPLIDKFFEAAMARRRRILSMVPTGE